MRLDTGLGLKLSAMLCEAKLIAETVTALQALAKGFARPNVLFRRVSNATVELRPSKHFIRELRPLGSAIPCLP